MSHSTAFPVNPDLSCLFAAEVHAQPPTISFVQVKIQEEALILGQTGIFGGDPVGVFENVKVAASSEEPSYFVVRDPSSATGKWLLVMFVPDLAKVKLRMLYAATRDTLKRALGYDNFSRDALCSTLDELSWSSVQDLVGQGQQSQSQPLTLLEIQATEERLLATDSHRDAKTKGMIVFPLTSQAIDAVKEFSSGATSFVQLLLNSEREIIDLATAFKASAISDVHGSMANDHPSYNLFRFNHTDPVSSTACDKTFLFLWCPMTAPAKEKMLSATIKKAVAQILEQSTPIHKQFDVDSLGELSDEALLSLLYPSSAADSAEGVKRSAAKASRPTKGGRRLIGSGRKELDGDDDE
eukprot:c7691_g1_i1.p1 GENE.c7691_g1_i1~~c7691_g1_i1.p1  ORF type:complete len:368 (+),score=98.48 c7691_g1_i1:45-1106(+)